MSFDNQNLLFFPINVISVIQSFLPKKEKIDFANLFFTGKDLYELILTAVSTDGSTLVFVSTELRNDKKIVLAAVSNFGMALKFASKELRDDKEVVLAAVSNDGAALEYACKEFCDDKEIVLKVQKKISSCKSNRW